jgi:uncharacterized protein
MDQQSDDVQPIPAKIGVGLRAPHFAHVASARPPVGWLEVHAENFMGGSPALTRLLDLRRDYPVSVHGVGLSLGTAEGLDVEHLRRFKTLIETTDPFLVSDHLSWSVTGDTYLNDLLPIPYTDESLEIVARNIEAAQDVFGRRILVENPSRYLAFRHSAIPEPDFLGELVRRTGCGILCDVNNIFVTCTNLDLDSQAYLDALPSQAVGEIHLAGHSRVARAGTEILIDDHASTVAEPVWRLYRRAVECFGLVPSLIEWDKDIPPFEVLLSQAEMAGHIANAQVNDNARAA